MIPILAREVRIIGGPTGPALGATGLTGPTAGLQRGATGWLGHTGHFGHTGLKGAAGDFSKFIGPPGLGGVTGSDGYPGPMGPTHNGILFGGDYLATFQNISGASLFSSFQNAVGCKFRYSIKNGPSQNGCTVIGFCSGLLTVDTGSSFGVGLAAGTGPAPNTHDFGGYPSGNFNQGLRLIQAPAPSGQAPYQIPFFLMMQWSFFTPADYAPTQFPQDSWFDVVCSPQDQSYGGNVTNITMVVMEFLY